MLLEIQTENIELLPGIAWPLITLVCIIIFSKPLIRLMNRMKSVSKGKEGLMISLIEETQKIGSFQNLSDELSQRMQIDLYKKILNHGVNTNPSLKVLALWEMLEARVEKAINYNKTSYAKLEKEEQVARFLDKISASEDLRKSFQELKKFRNDLYNQDDSVNVISFQEAEKFRKNWQDVIEEIDTLISRCKRFKGFINEVY